MKGWDDKIAELFLRGRVRDTFDKPQLAREWNTGNCVRKRDVAPV